MVRGSILSLGDALLLSLFVGMGSQGNAEERKLVETDAAPLKAALGPLGAELERQVVDFLQPEALQAIRQWRVAHAELGERGE